MPVSRLPNTQVFGKINNSAAPVSPLIQSLIIAPGCNLLTVTVAIAHSRFIDIQRISFNGQTLVWWNDNPLLPSTHTALWFLVNPPVGTFDLQIDFDISGFFALTGEAQMWSGVDLVRGPLDNISYYNKGTSQAASATATGARNTDMYLGWCVGYPCGSLVLNTGISGATNLGGQQALQPSGGGSISFNVATIQGGNPGAFAWSLPFSSQPWAAIAVRIVGLGAALGGAAADTTTAAGAIRTGQGLTGAAADTSSAAGALSYGLQGGARTAISASGDLITIPGTGNIPVNDSDADADDNSLLHSGAAYAALITSEHNRLPKFMALVTMLSDAFADMVDFNQDVRNIFDLDTAAGAQLDIVGLWVGQPRTIAQVIVTGYFGFSDAIGGASLRFGEQPNPSIGGRFFERNESFTATTLLSDNDYRLILRARIIRNQAHVVLSDLEHALQYIFGAVAVVTDPGNLTISIAVSVPITPTVRALLTTLDLLPRPAGIAVSSITFAP